MAKIYSKITGTGGYLPTKKLSNYDLEKIVETSHQWIVDRTGIRNRHIAEDNQSTSDLGLYASEEAIKNAGLKNNDIDLIIVATTTPDQVFPSTACLLQQKLKINNNCPAFDVQAVCSGFVYALSVADSFIKTKSAKNALVVGAETLSRIVNWHDRTTCVLFGDGAGAVVLSASEKPGILSTHLHANGSYAELLQVQGGIGNKDSDNNHQFIEMKGNEVFKMAVNTLGKIADETLKKHNMQKEDIDWLVPHQANLRIINATAKKLRLDPEKVIITVQEQGNTSSASVPLALHTGVSDGRIKEGETILLEAFGGGFTWGSALLKL
ncbi:MAG: 3-oxoacyl-ACP synthase [Gammaproteobacteria bacterium]|nr:MAG: 3-oxoacyl-ACP synthase [Gammaproteobacteria bacterium]